MDEEHMEPDSEDDITGLGLELPPFDMPESITPVDGSPVDEDPAMKKRRTEQN